MRWCRCCGKDNGSRGSFTRYYNIQAVADDQSISQANWTPVVVEGLPYLYNWLTSDAEAFVIMQPLRFTTLNSSTDGAVFDFQPTPGTSPVHPNSEVLPVGSHMRGGSVKSLFCPAFAEGSIQYQGQIGTLEGEPETSPQNASNLGQNPPSPYATKKGARPRYLRIWEDGVDVSGGLIDLDALNPSLTHNNLFWSVTDTVDFELLGHEFSLKQGKEYAFDLYIEMAVDGAGTSATCGHAIRSGQSIPYTASLLSGGDYTQYAAPLSRFSYMNFNGLANSDGFDRTRYAFAVTEWDGGDYTPPLPLILEESVGNTSSSGSVDFPPYTSKQDLYVYWSEEVARLVMPNTTTFQYPFVAYQPDDSNYAKTTARFSDGELFNWGSQGIFNIDGVTDFFPFSPLGEDITSLDSHYPTRIRVEKVRQTKQLKLTVSWTLTGWVAGETLTIHYDVRNPNKEEILNAFVQSTPHHTDLDDDERTIPAKASERYTVEQLITEADISSGEINITAFATGTRQQISSQSLTSTAALAAVLRPVWKSSRQ